jgi:hypothetical protein
MCQHQRPQSIDRSGSTRIHLAHPTWPPADREFSNSFEDKQILRVTVDKIQLKILPSTIDVMGYVFVFFPRFIH